MTELRGAMAQPTQAGASRKTYRVLMIAPTSFFADYGCHVRILEEALALQKLGNQVVICTYYQGRPIAGLDIRRTPPIPWRTDYEVGSSRHKIAIDALLVPTALAVAARFKPEIIHGHLHEGALIGHVVSKLSRAPLVFDFQGSMTSEMVDHHFLRADGPFYRPLRRLEEAIDHLPAAVVTSSYRAADVLTEEFGCAHDNVTVISDCVNADFFSPQQPTEDGRFLRQQLGIPADRLVIAYLGLLAEYQGTSLLLEAARELIRRRPEVQFLIMGYPSVEMYRQKAAEQGLDGHVVFTGKIPYEQAPRYLALGDVAVAPKITETEGSGKLLNYMAMALPTVSFDRPVNREYLGDLGVYAEPGNSTALADALERALEAREAGRAPAQELRKRAIQHYSWLDAAGRLMDVYDRISRRRRK